MVGAGRVGVGIRGLGGIRGFRFGYIRVTFWIRSDYISHWNDYIKLLLQHRVSWVTLELETFGLHLGYTL